MNKILYIISLFLILSCNQKKNDNVENIETVKKTEEEKREEIEKLERHQTLENISNRYTASIAFDTVNYKMTYEYQNLLSKNNRIIIDLQDFEITNVEKIDSNYIVSIEKGFIRKMFIEFICKQNQIEKICPGILDLETINTSIEDRFLVLKINSIKKLKFKIDSESEYDGGDGSSNYIYFDRSYAFICKGEFIDTYLKPKK